MSAAVQVVVSARKLHINTKERNSFEGVVRVLFAAMPGLLDGTCLTKKRKSAPDSAGNRVSKRRAIEDVKATDVDPQDQILLFENQILESRRHYNNIATLLALLKTPDHRKGHDVAAAVALCRVFSRLSVAGNLSKTKDAPENEAIIVDWLKERYGEYVEALFGLLKHGTSAKQSTALTLLLRLLKVDAAYINSGEERTWRNGLFSKLIRALVEADASQEVIEEFVEDYVEKYDDIRYYTFANIS